jgi:tetratricopeptide (TPR) repeat protein
MMKPGQDKINELMARAIKFLDEKDYQKEADVLCDVIALEPQHVDAHFYLGSAFGEMGKTEEAICNYRRCIVLGYDLPEKEGNQTVWGALQNLGMIYSDLNRLQEAADCFERCVQLVPGFSCAHVNLARIYNKLHRYEDSLSILKCGIDRNMGFAKELLYDDLGYAYYRLGQYEEAIVQWKQCLKLMDDQTNQYQQLGYAYRGLKQYDRAIVCFEKAIELGWKAPGVYMDLGILYFNQKRYKEAIVRLKTAIDLDPGHANAHYNLGIVYYDSGLVEDAIPHFMKAAELDPCCFNAYSGLGNCYEKLGKNQEAISFFTKAKEW